MEDDPYLDLTQDDIDEIGAFLKEARSQPDPLHTVLQRFGIESLRPQQKQAIDAVLSGRDVFLCLPTGGGKSLCFQIPSLLIGDHGLTIVVSPLVSLMANQVRFLNEKGIGCGLINSTVKARETAQLQAAVLQQTSLLHRILYTTPESFKTDAVLGLFRKLHEMKRIDLFAIDEAHCISTWGHSFRPSYQGLATIRSAFPSVPILACTATATRPVTNDIVRTLALNNPAVVKASFNRANIYYKIIWNSSLVQSERHDVLNLIKRFGRGRGGIIYCSTRAGCADLADFLNESGVAVGVYHAGLPNRERERVQSEWESCIIDIVIATIAFGMGIHRDDVSFIVHMNLPKSIENYYQETGRAGRNGKAAVAIMYYSKVDEKKTRMMLVRERNERVMSLFNEMVNLCTTGRCRRQQLLAYFGEQLEPANPPSSSCCDYCDDPALFERNRRMSEVSAKSLRHVLALASKHSKRMSKNDARPNEISLVDEPEQEESAGIYRLFEKKATDENRPKRRRKLTADITDIQRDLCRRRILQALKQNRIAAGAAEDDDSLNAAVTSVEQSVFDRSSAKSDYMAKSRDCVLSIQSFSNTLSLYDESSGKGPDLDLERAQARICKITSDLTSVNPEEIECITNALSKYFMTIETLRSSRIGKNVNELIKRMKTAGLHQTQKQLFQSLSSLLARWKDVSRQNPKQ